MAKTLLEISIEAGVPMPETSVKLNWQTKTKYYWIHIRKDNVWTWFLSFRIDDNLFVIKKNGEIEEYSFGFFEHQIPAPQMHEIAPLIENYELTKLFDMEILVKRDLLNSPYFAKQVIVGNHYAEDFANLYMQTTNREK